MTDLRRRRQAEPRSACCTAKEELAEAESATVVVAEQHFTVTAAMVWATSSPTASPRSPIS